MKWLSLFKKKRQPDSASGSGEDVEAEPLGEEEHASKRRGPSLDLWFAARRAR